MIECVRVQNFLSHSNTEIELQQGVNIFVGRNGSGKSSIVDAVTYSLFGEHTRGNSRNIVRRGSEGGFVSLRFSLGGKRFVAERRFNEAGSLVSAALKEISEGKEKNIVFGERKLYGESVSEKVQEILGLSYEELAVASVVQQGEIQAIVEYKPKDLKSLINRIIGIEKLEIAYQRMGEQISSFRQRLRSKYSFDDRDIPRIEQELNSLQNQRENNLSELKNAEEKLRDMEGEEKRIKDSIDAFEPLRLKRIELTQKINELRRYVSTRRRELASQLENSKSELRKIEESLKLAQEYSQINEQYKIKKEELENLNVKLGEKERELGRIKGLIELSGELEFKDNICPLCGSQVKGIKNIVDRDMLFTHSKDVEGEINGLKNKIKTLEKEVERSFSNLSKAKEAQSYLKEKSVNNIEDFEERVNQLKEQESALAKLPSNSEPVPLNSLAIDPYSSELVKEISAMEEQTKNFNQFEYDSLIDKKEKIQGQIRNLSGKIGALKNEKERIEKEMLQLNDALEQLKIASQYVNLYEKIRDEIFWRDGALSMSLRSWAVKYISEKASEYIRLFGIGITSIQLQESEREVNILCYHPRGKVDVSSLSGGETVAIALAVRFAMANLMGKGRVDFLVLDEPTVHLDSERKRSLVELIRKISSSMESLSLKQLIVITHDEEIIENSEISSIFKFEVSTEGTVVSRM